MKLMSLDLSVKCSGYATFIDGELIDHGSVSPVKYKGFSMHRYPQQSTRLSMSMSEQLVEIIREFNPDILYIEEVAGNGIAGIKSIKSLIMLHGIVLSHIPEYLGVIKFVKPSEWQRKLKINGKRGDAQKQASVDLVNETYGLDYILKDNDITDAINLGTYGLLQDND